MKISIIIPLYNEEVRTKKYLPLLLSALRKYPYPFEIILVNDGSSDKTFDLINNFKKQHQKSIKIVDLPRNFGKGFAVKKGVEQATGAYIFFTDIDLSVDLSILPHALKQLSNKKIHAVIASRRLPESKIKIHQKILRENSGRLFTFLAKKYLGLPCSDFTCGFKGFKKDVAKKIFPLMKNNRWSFDPEVLYLLKRYRYKTVELPAAWTNNPDTKVVLLKDILISFYELLRIRTNHRNHFA